MGQDSHSESPAKSHRVPDLNCDLGENETDEGRLRDSEILFLISSANVACGSYAGSRRRMQELAHDCGRLGVRFGAHPGFDDRDGFGRRVIDISPEQVVTLVTQQVTETMRAADTHSIPVTHVKPHGALYNMAAADIRLASAIATAVTRCGRNLQLYALSGSQLVQAGLDAGLSTVSEAFVDRAYLDDGSLVPRNIPGAVIDDPKLAADRALEMVRSNSVLSISGQRIPLQIDTLCLHSDTQYSLQIARCVARVLKHDGHL